MGRSSRPICLRQLVYLPQASVVVAELNRTVIGVAILALRPSVRAGGFVGTVDLLVDRPALRRRRRGRRADRGSPTIGPEQGLRERRGGSTAERGGTRPVGPARVPRVRSPPRTTRRDAARHHVADQRHDLTTTASEPRCGAPLGRSPAQGVNVGKNVAVFVDVANIFYAAKAAGVDIDYVTLLKSAIAGRDFVRAYAYTGLDPDNENQRNFHNFLARHDYKVVSKDIRKYGDGKVKANLDIELVVDMMKTAQEPRRRDRRVGRWRLRAGHPGGPGDGRPGRGDQLPREHLVGPDRCRRPVQRHHPDRPRREGLVAQRPAGRRRRRRPVDDRGPRQADRGHRTRPRSRNRPGPGSDRRRRARARGRERPTRTTLRPAPGASRRSPRRSPSPRPAAASAWSRCPARSCRRRRWPGSRQRPSPPTTTRPATDPTSRSSANGDEPRRRRRRGGRGRGRGRGRTEGGELERSPVAADGDRPIAADDDVDIDIEEDRAGRGPVATAGGQSTTRAGLARERSAPSGIRRSARPGPHRRSSRPRSTSDPTRTSRPSPSTSSPSSAAPTRPVAAVGRRVAAAEAAAITPRSIASATAAAAEVAGSTAIPMSRAGGPGGGSTSGRGDARRSPRRPPSGRAARIATACRQPVGRTNRGARSRPRWRPCSAPSSPNAATTDRHRPPVARRRPRPRPSPR